MSGRSSTSKSFRLVLLYPLECLIESRIASTCCEYLIETLFKLCAFVRARDLFVGSQLAVEFTYQTSYSIKRIALRIVEYDELVYRPLCVYPTQGMEQDIKRPVSSLTITRSEWMAPC